MILGLRFRGQISKIEVLLNGVELSNSQLHQLLFEPAPRHSAQQMYINNNLFNSGLQLELYRVLSLVSTHFNSIDPVVGLRLQYPIRNVLSTKSQDSRQQLSFFCRPHGMVNDLRYHLGYGVIGNKTKISWRRPGKEWVPRSPLRNMVSWWSCQIQQKNGSDGLTKVAGDFITLAKVLGDTGWPSSTPRRTTISFQENAQLVVLDNARVSPAHISMNMARFFERSKHPMFSSCHSIEFALKLSYSILTLSSTPWVEANWTWDNILVMWDSEKIDAELDVVIVHKLQSADESVEQAILCARSETQTLEEPLLTRLGFALTEIAFRKRLEESEDEHMYKTAMKLSETGQIAVREGRIYGDVVKACLTHSYHSGSEIKTISSSHPDFQGAVHEAILSPLHTLWSSMEKVRFEKSLVKNTTFLTRMPQERNSQESISLFPTRILEEEKYQGSDRRHGSDSTLR